jgi:hypothetical protein
MPEHETYDERRCWRILGLKPGTDRDTLKKTYRDLVKKYHPDLGGSSADARRCIGITTAYQELIAILPPEPPRRDTQRQSAQKDNNATPSHTASRTEHREHRMPGTEELMTIVRTSRFASQREFAVRTLANSGRRTVYPALKAALYDDSDRVIAAAVAAIGKLRILQAGGELSAVFHRGTPEIRMTVLETIASYPSLSPFRNIIRAGLIDPDRLVRRTALEMYAGCHIESEEGTHE